MTDPTALRRAEVAVVGAGPAGCVAALLLARLGARVVLVHDPVGARGRPPLGEVVPRAGRIAFERLGLGALLADAAHAPVPGTIADWGGGGPEVVAEPDDGGGAVVVDRLCLDGQLLDAAVAAGARVVTVPRGAWGRIAPRPGAGRMGPACVVDAGGRAAPVARAAGARLQRGDRLTAIVGVLMGGPVGGGGDVDWGAAGDHADGGHAGHRPLDRRVLVAACEAGWWSSLLLPDGRRIAALHADADLVPPGPAAADIAGWWAALRSVPLLGPAVARECRVAPPALRIVAAGSQRLLPPPGGSSRVVAAGDAEMAFDPLSSLGILGAVSSAEEALPVVAGWMDGEPAALRAHVIREAAREARWTRYRARLADAYGRERRWPGSPFWARRGAVGQGAAGPGADRRPVAQPRIDPS